MKPRRKDVAVQCLISGLQLTELQKYTDCMIEAFGLNNKIERYKGKRPISLYRWDLDCILDVIDLSLNDTRNYPNPQGEGYLALLSLHQSLKTAYRDTYEG